MKFFRPFLLFISLVFLGWLMMSNINLINAAKSLNESEINSQVEKVNSFSDIDRLKEFTIERINYIEVIRHRFSDNAMVRIGVIVALLLIQIVLYTTRKKTSSKTIF